MLKHSLLILITFLHVSYEGLLAQNKPLEYVQHLSIYEGLAHNGVTSILEDSKGYLWFGTYDGLNRYDGYNFKTFKNTTDKKILASNRIRVLSEDKTGNILIGTDEGITIYNYEKRAFKNIYSNKLNKKSYWFNKANIFTLIIELIQYDLTKIKRADFSSDLSKFEAEYYSYNKMEEKENFEESIDGQIKYFEYAREGVNEIPAREHRGKIINSFIIKNLEE